VGAEEVRAVWITQYDQAHWLVDGDRPRDAAEFRRMVRQAARSVASAGLNTVFLQVRPFGDSFYPSALYPPSQMAVGTWGGAFVYDPLQIWVEETARAGLALHAWINPFRAMREAELLQVDDAFAIRRWREDPTLCGTRLVEVDGRWYLNPGDAEARALIVAGVEELLEGYALAGIHLDDYFYPTVDPSFDALLYARDGGWRSLGDFRRAQVDRLLLELHAVCREAGVWFGVSPAGDPDACYERDFADVLRWVEEGYVDYLCPQVYWGFRHQTHGFARVCARWQELVQGSGVALVIGLTLEKAVSGYDGYAGSGAFEWSEEKDILARSAAVAALLPDCAGVAVFCYSFCFDVATGEPCAAAAAEREGLFAALRRITFPRGLDRRLPKRYNETELQNKRFENRVRKG
jgi:uncharacterized lipoprotein YddW (UPF0748 family)